MQVMLVSQCDDRALIESRRLLDNFLPRLGTNAWQGEITEAGLTTLYRLLRASARKNTGVACHKIGGRKGTELLWIVGDRGRFNAGGQVPTRTTERDILRSEDQNDWDSLPLIALLAEMAGLLHDFGKLAKAFQERLKFSVEGRGPKKAALYRHEWASLRLLESFVAGRADQEWLADLQKLATDGNPEKFVKKWRRNVSRDGLDRETGKSGTPFASFENSPLARALGWLIVSHHRLPCRRYCQGDLTTDVLENPLGQVTAEWNRRPDDGAKRKEEGFERKVKAYWDFPKFEALGRDQRFREKLADAAGRWSALLEKWPDSKEILTDPYVLHWARLSLMLADHHFSARPPEDAADGSVSETGPFANTDITDMKGRRFKQTLAGHLVGVAEEGGRIARSLASLPRAVDWLAPCSKGERNLSRRVPQKEEMKKFLWQNRAVARAEELREAASRDTGAFIVNMASTGCGKTRANAKILLAFADPKKGLRLSYALGLRVLTKQTGEAYRDFLELDEKELGIFVGGGSSAALEDFLEEKAGESGSASSVQSLLGAADFFTDEEGDEETGGYEERESPPPSDDRVKWKFPVLAAVGNLQKISSRDQVQEPRARDLKFLQTPVLVSTVDHLMPAVESLRGGRQILPMLRLASSDLVLDELDDFDLKDMPALVRLTYWAGMLGAKVLISSATLPADLIEGFYLAYRAGREIYQRNHGGYAGGSESPAGNADIPVLFVDEFGAEGGQTPVRDRAGEAFRRLEKSFLNKRKKKLQEKIARSSLKRGKIVPVAAGAEEEGELAEAFARTILGNARGLHGLHGETDPRSGKKASFGLVRMANIAPLYRVAQALEALGSQDADTALHLCVYHARFPLLFRSIIEHHLDRVLNRKSPEEIWENREVREALEESPARNHIFLVLASPVCEVGRDWDADWAIAEPSSMRSIIQLAGRVRRHRTEGPPVTASNIHLLDKNYKTLKGEKSAFCFPGFEDGKDWKLTTHALEELLQPEQYERISALPRIQWRNEREAVVSGGLESGNLAELELARTAAALLPHDHSPESSREGLTYPDVKREEASVGWQFSQAALSGLLPRFQPFREDREKKKKTLLCFRLDENGDLKMWRLVGESGKGGQSGTWVKAEGFCEGIKHQPGAGCFRWINPDWAETLREYARGNNIPFEEIPWKLTALEVKDCDDGYLVDSFFGITPAK